jgi:hypothetical protein
VDPDPGPFALADPKPNGLTNVVTDSVKIIQLIFFNKYFFTYIKLKMSFYYFFLLKVFLFVLFFICLTEYYLDRDMDQGPVTKLFKGQIRKKYLSSRSTTLVEDRFVGYELLAQLSTDERKLKIAVRRHMNAESDPVDSMIL